MVGSFGCVIIILQATCLDPSSKTCSPRAAPGSKARTHMIRILVIGLFFLGAACGGTPRNAALKNRVSEARLAPVSVAQRSQEAATHQAVFLAEWQLAFTKGQLEGAELEVKIAKNDLASAKLGMKSALLEKKAADESGDMNRMKEATQKALIAEKEAAVHTLAIDRAKRSMSYLKKRVVYEESMFRSFEAKLEVDRAESLNAAGIVPPDFKLKTYKSQYADRQAQAKTYKSAVDTEHKELKSIDAQLAKAKTAAQAAKTGGAPPDTTAPVKMMPDLKPVPPVGAPTPTDPKPAPADPPPPPKSDPTPAPTETPAPTPAPPKPAPAPAPSTSDATTTGDQR